MAYKEKEEVLVVLSNLIFKKEKWQGLKTDNLEYYIDLIKKNARFKTREEVEKDPSWQQIIPYILFNFKNKFFLYRYLEKAGEDRLKNDFHLGIAGHINPIDAGDNIIEKAAMREWQEEIDYKGNLLEKKMIGIVNDDRREVESVHLGIVYFFKGDSFNISVKEKDKLKGEMVSLDYLKQSLENKTTWAEIIYKEYLSKNII